VSTLTVTGATLEGRTVGVRCGGGKIVALGPGVSAEPGDEVLDAAGLTLLPGFVNGHTHAAMTLLRGCGDDLALMDWLRTAIWPREARLEPEDVYWGTRLACVEMVRSGTVAFWDMYWHAEEVARAARDAGMRVTVGIPIIEDDSGTGVGAGRDQVEATLARLEPWRGEHLEIALAPHAVYTVTPDTLSWVAEVAAARGLPVQIHVSETEGEVHDCVAAHGVTPAALLERLGVLGERAVLAHGVWLDDDELALIAARGATVVTNPVSNLKLATGRVFPYPRARAHGVAVGLGTDGPASNNSLDLLQEVKFLALLQKHAHLDPTVLPATEAWELLTGRYAPRLGATYPAVGERADFLLARVDEPELAAGDPVADLVYAATGAVVDTTVIGGRVVMRARAVADQDDIIGEVRRRAERLAAG
jgi:5-methylthioadenosine/S-adenosylhomocysteine deaminase